MIVAILIKEINEELPLANSNLTAKAAIFLVRDNQACIYAQQEYAKQFTGITVIYNNYSPKWRWVVLDIYRTAKQ